MTKFQGTGFTVELPDDAIDASAYYFVRNDGSANPPTLRISAQSIVEIPADVDSYITSLISQEIEAAPNMILVDKAVKQREEWIYSIVTVAWGSESTSPRQRRIYLYVNGDPLRQFTITVTATNHDFEVANDYFAESIRSFTPNDIQNLLPHVG